MDDYRRHNRLRFIGVWLMHRTHKIVYLFCTEGCAACEGMHELLTGVFDQYDEVHVEKLMADDGERGSALATALRIQGGMPCIATVEVSHGRRGREFFERWAERFAG